jgi:glycosyltransferase involved in cell wall biosynthesis
MPKVSIIIPLHNAEPYIIETLESCLQQSHTDIEIIVVENGSSDRSLEKVYEIKDSRLRVFEIGKASATQARNYGFKEAKGDYIQYLDADDVLSNNKIEDQIKFIEQYGESTIVSCAWGKFNNHVANAKFNKSLVWRNYEKPIEWLIDSWTGGGMMQTACWLTHRNLIEKAGLWDETLKKNPNDDGDFFCRVLLKAERILFAAKSKVYYRMPTSKNVSENRSNTAVASLLGSFYSYQNEILKVEESKRVRTALAYNYSRFIYEFYPQHKQLIQQAQAHIKALGVATPIVGGQKFQKLAQSIGFYNALRLRELAIKLKEE